MALVPYCLMNIDIKQYIKVNLRGGKLTSKCWASGWEEKFDEWLDRVMTEITVMLSEIEPFEDYCGRLNDVLGVFGSSKLLEGMWAGNRNVNTPHTLAAIGLWNSDTKPQLSTRYYHAEVSLNLPLSSPKGCSRLRLIISITGGQSSSYGRRRAHVGACDGYARSSDGSRLFELAGFVEFGCDASSNG